MRVKLTQEKVKERIQLNFKQNVQMVGEYKNRRANISLQCLDCGYKWDITAGYVLYGDNHECPNCGKHHQQENVVVCANCGKELIRSSSKIKSNASGNFYCSKQCGNQHKNNIRKENGEWDNSATTYRKRAFESYEHKCCVCGWGEDERILEVHHIDQNRTNNFIDNLCILCPTCHRKITLNYYKLTKDFQLIEI